MNFTAREGCTLLALGAVLGLDHAAWASLLWAQPLVAGAVAGAVLGHLEAGVAAGAVAQMLYLGALPVGGARLPEAWLAGFAAATAVSPDVTLQGSAWLDDPRLTAPVLVGVGAASLGRALLALQRSWQQQLASRAHARLASGDAGAAAGAVRAGLVLHATRGAVAAGLALWLAPEFAAWIGRLGLEVPAGRLALALAAVTLAGAARRRGRAWLLLVGVAAGGLVGWL